MPDRILTFQQDSVLQDIELFLTLSKRDTPPQQMKELLDSVTLLVEDEKHLYPEGLHPAVFFKGKMVFGNRAPRPQIRLWFHKLHKYLDLKASKTLPG